MSDPQVPPLPTHAAMNAPAGELPAILVEHETGLVRLRAVTAMRELGRLLLSADASPEDFAAVADQAEQSVALLQAAPARVADQWERNAVVGRLNVVAPPLDPDPSDPDVFRCRTTLTLGHGGPEGSVHGGVVAEILDMCFGAVSSRTGTFGVTGTMTLRYSRPTPLDTPLLFEAWVDRVEGRKIFVEGRVLAGDDVCVTGVATMIVPRDAAESHRMQD